MVHRRVPILALVSVPLADSLDSASASSFEQKQLGTDIIPEVDL